MNKLIKDVLTLQAIAELEELSVFLHPDPERIYHMPISEVDDELRSLGLDPDQSIPQVAKNMIGDELEQEIEPSIEEQVSLGREDVLPHDSSTTNLPEGRIDCNMTVAKGRRRGRIHGTIVLDSGAFLENLQAGNSYSQVRVGCFQSEPTEADLRAYADGAEVKVGDTKLGSGRIDVRHTDSSGNAVGGIRVTAELAAALFRLSELYPGANASFDQSSFDCTLYFTSGRFCCSMVKTRRFKDASGNPTYTTPKPIAHNVVVHYNVASDEELEITRASDGTVLFSTTSLPSGTARFEVEIIADNPTAVRFYRDAVLLGTNRNHLLPHQGDPPTLGLP